MSNPKAPQDRKPKAEKAEPITRPEDTPGFNLLKSIDEVPVWDQAPLLGLINQLVGGAKEGEEFEMDEDNAIPILGEIGKAMLPWANDPKEFTKFCSGKEALQRIADLAMAWTQALGEGESSEAS